MQVRLSSRLEMASMCLKLRFPRSVACCQVWKRCSYPLDWDTRAPLPSRLAPDEVAEVALGSIMAPYGALLRLLLPLTLDTVFVYRLENILFNGFAMLAAEDSHQAADSCVSPEQLCVQCGSL